MAGGVWAVTVAYNSAGDIGGLLESLAAEGDALAGITVVDNASADGTPALVRKFAGRPAGGGSPSVEIIENPENLGFAAAANQGIRASKGEYVLLVNPDVSFEPGFVKTLLDALSADPEAGAAAPKLMRPDGSTVDSAGLVMRKDRKAVDRGRDLPDSGEYGVPAYVFGPTGAAGLLRRAMLEDAREPGAGGVYFDESFFSYKEDVDLAWRANLLGWRTVYVPAAVATHSRGWKVSGRKSVPRAIRRHSHKNRYLTIIKNDDPLNLALHLPWFLFYELKLFVYALFFEPFLLLAFRDVAGLLPGALEKRRGIMKRRRADAARIRDSFAPREMAAHGQKT